MSDLFQFFGKKTLSCKDKPIHHIGNFDKQGRGRRVEGGGMFEWNGNKKWTESFLTADHIYTHTCLTAAGRFDWPHFVEWGGGGEGSHHVQTKLTLQPAVKGGKV